MPCYTVTINVNEIKYDNKLYYHINYNIVFIPSVKCSIEQNDNYKLLIHPFRSFSNSNLKFESVIVYKNILTKTLIEFLLMNYSDIEKISGLTTPERYKANIMEILALFKITNQTNETNEDKPYYILSVINKEIEYNNGSCYYDIKYNLKFISSEKYEKLFHPFASFNNEDDVKFEDVIVYKNSLTVALVEFLLMDYESLEKMIKHTTIQSYKSSIMESLSLLWD